MKIDLQNLVVAIVTFKSGEKVWLPATGELAEHSLQIIAAGGEIEDIEVLDMFPNVYESGKVTVEFFSEALKGGMK